MKIVELKTSPVTLVDGFMPGSGRFPGISFIIGEQRYAADAALFRYLPDRIQADLDAIAIGDRPSNLFRIPQECAFEDV